MMQPRWFQQEAVDNTIQYFMRHDGNPLIVHPTGTGKSYTQALFMQTALTRWPGQRFLALTHVKELIEQNAEEFLEAWPGAPMGICSAGLNRRDTSQPIIFGGCKTVVNRLEEIGYRDLMFVDEAHLVSPEENTTYQTIWREMRKFNPYIKVVGLTATDYRMGQGRLTDDGLFTDVVHDMSKLDNFDRLIAEGYLSVPIPRATRTQIDLTGVRITKGDYNQLQLQSAIDKAEITHAALKEACEYGYDRHSWLVFASGVEHCDHIADTLNMWGINAVALHSKLGDGLRDANLKAWKCGQARALVCNNIGTIGLNHPPIDLIVMLRPTASAGLWVQMVGRGTRPYDYRLPNFERYASAFPFVKQNCLVLDFAGNTRRLGPINDPVIPRKKGEKAGDVPIKICDNCGSYNHTRARYCIGCGKEFEFEVKFKETADNEALIKSQTELPPPQTFDVERVHYISHKTKKNPLEAIRVSYFCGYHMFEELVCLEHPGFPGVRARQWWRQRHTSEPPPTSALALTMTSYLRNPKQIRVNMTKPYPTVIGYEWN